MYLEEKLSGRKEAAASAVASILVVSAFYLIAVNLWSPPRGIVICAGFFTLFVIPGLMLGRLLLDWNNFDLLERYPVAVLLSMGVWSFPGLIAFSFEMTFETVFYLFLAIILILCLCVITFPQRMLMNLPPQDRPQGLRLLSWAAFFLVLAVSVLSYFLQAQRGFGLDWDFYNYISAVRKLSEGGVATNAHFAYTGAPPDPVHSYNIWSLAWSLIARFGRLDPIELYLNSSFLTAPAALLAFYALAKKILSSEAAFAAFAVYVFYHVFYGGLHFLGTTTFYPADSMWLIAFPAAVSLFIHFTEKGGARSAVALALSVHGMAIIHVLWGLAFYMTAAFFIAAYIALKSEFIRFLKKGRRFLAFSAVAIFFMPYAAFFLWAVVMASRDAPDWHKSLFGTFPGDSVALYAIIFVILPLILLIASFKHWRKIAEAYRANTYSDPPFAARAAALVALALVISVPYITLRFEAIQSTQWQSFGVNPYRGLITDSLFMLNPFVRSLANPNMTFYPLFIAGLFSIPWLLKMGMRSKNTSQGIGSILTIAVIILVPMMVFNPVFASIFAKLFTLGYLRRILRLAAIFSIIPIGALTASMLAKLARRRVLFILSVLLAAFLVSAASIPFPAEPAYYNRMFSKMTKLLNPSFRDSLLYDDAPFVFLRDSKSLESGQVIMSDLYTSFRLTAYLDNYVVAQHKPGVGVPDQEERKKDENTFFSPQSSLDQMMGILDKYSASLVIVNRNPSYRLYNYTCGHPETIGKLSRDKKHFQKIYDTGDWAVFSYRTGK